MGELERAVAERVEVAEADDPVPYRAYALYRDRARAPALYVEVVVEDRVAPVIVHNFRYYGMAMGRWNAGVVETLVLNELHELTHWAMTDEEREELDARSRDRGLPDGFWLNGPLLEVVDWVGEDYATVTEGGPSGIERVRRRIAWSLRRLLPAVRPRLRE